MHRFFAPPGQCRGSVIELDENETHHALHVLRAQAGDRAVVLDGAGSEVMCEIERCSRQGVALAVRHRNSIPPLPFRITLIQAVAKSKAMDSIVQKAAELGVHRLVSVCSDRTVPQLDEGDGLGRVAKWQRVAIEALKQCGSAWLPRLEAPIPLANWLGRREVFDLSLLASLQPGARHPRFYFAERPAAPKNVAAWIGPEGDFTPAEIQSILAHGAQPITLGPLVLRSDTAAIYTLSVLNHELSSHASE